MQEIFTVTGLNKYIKELVSSDEILADLWVKGEISNYKPHYSGHLYFTLKDEKSIIKCVMFRGQSYSLKFTPENGLNVIARGYVSVFERDGQYQLYVEEMQPDGLGSLYLAFEQLKKKLEAEGLFDKSVKKKLPFLPRSIGVVTSSTGAVIRDIINVASRRFPNMEIKLLPVAVQGEQAAQMISRAIKVINKLNCVDVLIVARGGGSLEELWPFNEEIVARSIYESRIPVVSAVGHETDFTISDFVADVRAPTPSAAAEIVVPEKRILKQKITDLELRLQNALLKSVSIHRMKYDRLSGSIIFKQPYSRINQERLRLDNLNRHMYNSLAVAREKVRMHVSFLVDKLNMLSPLNVLARGYGIVRSRRDNKLIRSVNDTGPGDKIEITLKDGSINATVE
ncbi:MAG: exodeoxyribonuclease VII large subunit [Clostridiaceae bacterium]|nr:exodeoxyribonuclease VII large subunit [Clostridiaceae bacterium]